jgi:tetratricopeptide (TPR) repeat protein
VAELVSDSFWLPSVANARAWILLELLDTESALRLDTHALRLAHESGDADVERPCHINLARDFLALGELERALEHLEQADLKNGRDDWFHWVSEPRVQAEMASYWIARGDSRRAATCARVSLERAERTLSRKRIAWARKLLGDVAVMDDRPEDARREFSAALQVLEHHACPTIEWQILRAAAAAAGACRDSVAQSELLARARAVAHGLADSVREETLRRKFLDSKSIRELGVGRL